MEVQLHVFLNWALGGGFVGTMVSNILRDLPFSRNQSPEWAGDKYNSCLRNKINLGSLR
jgi:hypothetical protein